MMLEKSLNFLNFSFLIYNINYAEHNSLHTRNFSFILSFLLFKTYLWAPNVC